MESSAKSYEAERRSTRIRAQIPLRVMFLSGWKNSLVGA